MGTVLVVRWRALIDDQRAPDDDRDAQNEGQLVLIGASGRAG